MVKRLMQCRLLLMVLVCLCVPLAARAEDKDYEQRLELAKKMYEYRPVKAQVEAAIDRVAEVLPEDKREAYRLAMHAALNEKALEKISEEAMAKVYTNAELEAMVEYYSKPEARSAGEKFHEYQAIVQPEITKMLDKAMMRQKMEGR